MLTEEQKDDLQTTVNSEGFCYSFIDYSDWKEIKDKEFQKLNKRFVKAYKELKDYCEIED